MQTACAYTAAPDNILSCRSVLVTSRRLLPTAMIVRATHTLIAILMVYVVVLNMVLSNIMYSQRFRHNSSDPLPQLLTTSTRTMRAGTRTPSMPASASLSAAEQGLVVLVLVRGAHSSAAAPVARLMMQLRAVAWQTAPRIVLAMPRATAMSHYNDWCLLTELQCGIAVLGDMSAAGLIQYLYNTDMCCTRAGLPTHDMLMLHETTQLRRGFARLVATAAPSAVSCLQGSPCQAYYVPAACIVPNSSQWGPGA